MRSAAVAEHHCVCESISRLAEILPAAIWVVADDGTVVYANRAARELTAETRDAAAFTNGGRLRLVHLPHADVLVLQNNGERSCIAFAEQPVSRVLLRRLYALTAAEARVAVALASGRTPRQVADHLLVSLHTVRAHIKSIFAKTETRSQNELVAVLARGIATLRLDDASFGPAEVQCGTRPGGSNSLERDFTRGSGCLS